MKRGEPKSGGLLLKRITRGILENPGSYWRHLLKDGDPD
jgi:hypothetical protein